MNLLHVTLSWWGIALLFLVAHTTHAQKEPEPPITFGKLSEADKSITKYDKDPDATAVVLCDYGKSEVQFDQTAGFFMKYSCNRRIKIFKQEAANQYANGQILLSIPSREALISLKATAYNLENGHWMETKMDKSSIFQEKYDENRKQVKFSIPNVKAGTIIEYEYSLNKDSHRVRDWYFQSNIPKIHSEYRFTTPNYFGYTLIFYGFTPFAINDKIEEITYETGANSMAGRSTTHKTEKYRWVQQHVPAFKDEVYIASSEDYLSRVEFQLAYYQFPRGMMETYFSTWEDLVKKLRESEYFGRKTKKSGTSEDIIKEITQGKNDSKEKVQAIYDYVKNTYKWNERHDFIAEQSLKDLQKSKLGTSADINMALISLLKTCDMDANPILISTRDNGKINPQYPILDKFDDVIAHVKIGNEELILDATDPVRPMNMLPYDALNGNGFFINMNDKTFKWLPLQNSFKAMKHTTVDVTIDDAQQMTTNIAKVDRGYDAIGAMKTIKNKGENEFFKEIYKDFLANGKMIEKKVENNGTEVLKYNAKLTTTDFIETSGNLIYLNPMLSFGVKENPFKAQSRQYPVDFVHPKDDTYLFSLAIPKGYKMSEVPKSTRMAWQDGSVKFDYIVDVTEQKIAIKTKIVLKNPIFSAASYPELRDFYGKIAAKHNEQIVLTKIK
jgi:Domain of Unknown Function with PDB structure (DUF3857)/Transglutaminase-like superfamily